VKRLCFLFLGLAFLVLVPFFIWGEWWEAIFTYEGSIRWLETCGPWAWVAGIGLLASDLVLPVPGTVVMAAMGWIYGWLVGGLVNAAGSVLAGLLGYGLCRLAGERAARWLLGEADLRRAHLVFDRAGPWAVVLSRWLPVFPEVVACLAGLLGMPFRVFFPALLAGSLPLAFLFAWVGSIGYRHPGVALALSAVIPALLWLVARRLLARWEKHHPHAP
jgi:uncharacterized membrane protein YdjX (TVP38/TMEM64 family)